MSVSMSVSSRAIAARVMQAAGVLGLATAFAGALPAQAPARDFFGFSRPYAPQAYYAPYYDNRPRYEGGSVDPLARRTAEQLRRAPKPPPAKGPLLISVSLSKQQLTVYDDGVPVAQSRISSGNASYPSPTGLFSVIQKQRWHRSNLYSDAPMPFMQRITWSGVAFHAGQLPGYPASHGCIRLPDDFAVRLWRTTSMGTRVVISQKDIVPVEVSHAKLFKLPASDVVPMAQQSKPSVQPAVAAAPAATGAAATATPASDTAGDNAAKGDGKAGEGKAGEGKAGETRVASNAPVAPSDTQPAEKPLRSGPISVFVSRKEQRVYVRKGFEPVFDMPVVIQNPEQPLGTHLFMAMNPKEGSTEARWMVVSPPPKETGVVGRREAPATKSKKKGAVAEAAPVTPAPSSPAAAVAALDRIDLPAEAQARIADLMSVGAALTITDEGLGPETGKETDFVVVTSPIQPTKKRPNTDRYERAERWDRYDADRYWRNSRRWF